MMMPFGVKWKGQPIDTMATHDPKYCRWLITLAGFREHHPEAYVKVRDRVIQELHQECQRELMDLRRWA